MLAWAPGRDLMFFTFAAAIAYRRGISVLVGGMCESDYSGYPDCRDDTLKAAGHARPRAGPALRDRNAVEWIDKAQTWEMAERLGGKALVELIRLETHSCYFGDHSTLHAWGYGCGGVRLVS